MGKALDRQLVGQVFFQRHIGVAGPKRNGLGQVHADTTATADYGPDVLPQAKLHTLVHLA